MSADRPKWRSHYVAAPQFYNLNQACTLVNRAFDGVCYLVGSSLARKDYRDVDVRMILDDDAYAALFGQQCAGYADAKWSLLCVTISLWLSQQSGGLPIDFQIQQRTQANQQHDGARNAIGLFLTYPGESPSEVTQ